MNHNYITQYNKKTSAKGLTLGCEWKSESEQC